MSRLNIFQITLSNLEGTYYAGQTVEGHCTVELVRDMCMKDLQVKFKGECNVSWTEKTKHGSDSSLNEVTKAASETYVDQSRVVLSDESKGSVTLPAGRHSFPFSFSLPPSVPATFYGKHGEVKYTLKAVISRPWKTDHDAEREVMVLALVDLNLDPKAEAPCEVQEEEMVCCLCCQSGPVVAKFRIERTGHILGDEVQFSATVDNGSRREVDSCNLYLEMESTYRAEGEEKTSTEELCRIQSECFSVKAGESSTWNTGQDKLVVPHDVAPSGLPGCSLMDVSYKVALFVNMAWASGVTISVPIIIGTFPSRYALVGDPPRPCQPLQMTPMAGYPLVPPPDPEQLRAAMALASAPEPEGPFGEKGPSPSAPNMGVPLSGFDHLVSPGDIELKKMDLSSDDVPLEPPPSYDKCAEMWGSKA